YIFLTGPVAPNQLYSLSLHDALPISVPVAADVVGRPGLDGHRCAAERELVAVDAGERRAPGGRVERHVDVLPVVRLCAFVLVNLDRKSTRLNSSHVAISYAVFCLKKK